MDYCAELPAIEARLIEHRLPAGAGAPEPLRDDLRECLDGEAGRRETLVDRARRCLAQDPLDPDAARLLGYLGSGSGSDVRLLAPGVLSGGIELYAPLAVGDPLVDDLDRWVSCVRGAAPGWLTAAPAARPALRGPPSFDPVAWRERVLGDSEWEADQAMREALARPLLDPQDQALIEQLAAEPWRQRGRVARRHLYQTALNQWPVPSVVVAWAREDIANQTRDGEAAGVLARADGRPFPRIESGEGSGEPPTEIEGPEEMAALLAAPRPRFPGPAVRVTDAAEVRATALAAAGSDWGRALFLLGFVAGPDDLDRIAGQLGGAYAREALEALARIRTDRALDLLEHAAAAPNAHHAQGALAASRTERGWVAALASWKGRTDLTLTHTTAGCALPLILWDAGVRAYLDSGCVLPPSRLRGRVEAAAAAGQPDAVHALSEQSASAIGRARAPLFDPDPTVRARAIDALLANPDEPALKWLRLSVHLSPIAVAEVVRRAAERPELVRELAPELRSVKLPPELEPAGLAELRAQLPPEEVDPLVAMMQASSRVPRPPFDPGPSLAECLEPATPSDERFRLLQRLGQARWEDGLEPCLKFAIRQASDDQLPLLAGFVEGSARTEVAWIALTERLPTASPKTAEALAATFTRVGLPRSGVADPQPLPRP